MGDGLGYGDGDGEGLFDRLDAWDDIDVEAALEESQDAEQALLEEELARIEKQLDGRDAVHEEIVDELEWKIERYTDRLSMMYKRGRGKRDGKRERMKDRIEQFYRDLREERRKHWRDRQELENVRREVLHELGELEDSSLLQLL